MMAMFVLMLCVGMGLLIYAAYQKGYERGFDDRGWFYLNQDSVSRVLRENGYDIPDRWEVRE